MGAGKGCFRRMQHEFTRTIRWTGVGLALCALLWLVPGCRPEPRSESAHDAQSDGMPQASELQHAAQYAEAARQLRKVLRSQPDNALAHFELAILLQDNQQDEAGAIYHLRSYLDLRPESDKAQLARDRLSAAEEKLAARFGGRGDGGTRVISDAQIVQRIEELNGLVTERDRTIQQLNNQIAEAQKENTRLAKDVASLERRVDLMLRSSASTSARAPSPALANRSLDAQPATPTSQRPVQRPVRAGDRTYRVRQGDSLWSIAQKVYGNPSRDSDIRNANRSRIGPNDRLNEGDELIIPFP